MRCLVTGNHGFIGYILTNHLLKAGYDVVGYDCDYFPISCFGRKDTFDASKKIKQISKDIRDINKEDLKGVDAVIHLAALPNDPACDLNPFLADDINYLATVQLATAARRAGVKRFIYASSCSVFGVKGNEIINEEDSPAPLTPYGFSKLKSEIALKGMNSSDFTVTLMRNATCFGVSPRMRFDMVLNNLMGYAFTEGNVKILSDGTSWRPIVHIEDVAEAYKLTLEAPKTDVASQVFAVGGENYQVKDIAEIVRTNIPKSAVEYAKGGQKDLRSYRVNFNKIEKILGFKMKWTTDKGCKELLKAYKEFRLDKENFQDKWFWAGKAFKYLIASGKVDKNLRLKD